MANISAEQHNMTRRAAKAKRKGGGKKSTPVATESVFEGARKDRQRQAYANRMEKENRARLLKELTEKKFIELRVHEDAQFYEEQAWKQFFRDVRDIKAVIKEMPASERRKYKWEDIDRQVSGDEFVFRVAMIRR